MKLGVYYNRVVRGSGLKGCTFENYAFIEVALEKSELFPTEFF